MCSVVAALMTAGPPFAGPFVGHGTTADALTHRASPGTILPSAESTLLALVNRVRQQYGHRSLLIVDARLRAIARRHSQEMALRGYVGHGSPDGRSIWNRLASARPARIRLGENVIAAQTIEQGHRAFVASRAHLRNMLDPAFRRAGIGVAAAGDGRIMITEDFAE